MTVKTAFRILALIATFVGSTLSATAQTSQTPVRVQPPPQTQCPVGTLLPNCTTCSVDTHCNGHAFSTQPDVKATKCVCMCRNQWSGTSCNKCDPKFAGNDCDRCAPGFTNYPGCTPIQKEEPALEQKICAEKCTADKCKGSAMTSMPGGGRTCQCTDCEPRKRICATTASGKKAPCKAPANECQVMNGRNQCVVNENGKNVWAACGPC